MSSNEDNKFAEIWKFGIHILRNFDTKEEKRLFVNITTQRSGCVVLKIIPLLVLLLIPHKF